MSRTYHELRGRIDAAAQLAGHEVTLLAVSKTNPASAIGELAALGQLAFGENYVQEALAKQREIAALNWHGLALQWHLIGPLQSNKAREVAEHFNWLQSLDREKLIEPLNRLRPENMPPLNVLIQVNIDGEASKSGCTPDAVSALAHALASAPRLRLRGLMSIPEPTPDAGTRRHAFQRMYKLYDALKSTFPQLDTLSMGMSEDFELAIAEGATMVRVGSAIFGPRG